MRAELDALLSTPEAANARRLLSQGRHRLARWRQRRTGLRGMVLYLLAAPLLLATLKGLAAGDLIDIGASLAAFVMIAWGARLNRRGMLERLTAAERRFTTPTRFPHQHAAMLLVSGGTMLAAASVVGHGIVVAAVFTAIAATGFHFAYRLPLPRDPNDARRTPIADPVARERLRQAEERLLKIERAALSIGNAELEWRLQRIAAQGRAVLEQLAQRPDDLHRSRRFLNVHLEGAERVAVRYAKSHRVARGGALEQRFRSVLTQIETAFMRQRQHLAERDLGDLDIQIEVLRKQLQREGFSRKDG